MNTKGKTRKTPKHSPDFVKVTFQEVDSYRDKFAEWLEKQAGKQAKAAFFGLEFLYLISRYDVTLQGEIDVTRARRSLQKLLGYKYNPDNQTTGKTPSGGAA